MFQFDIILDKYFSIVDTIRSLSNNSDIQNARILLLNCLTIPNPRSYLHIESIIHSCFVAATFFYKLHSINVFF